MNYDPMFDPQDLFDNINGRFDYHQVGPARAYFELPDQEWRPVKYTYEVIAIAAERPHLARIVLLDNIDKLRATVTGPAWIYWRRMPTCSPAHDPNVDLSGMTEEEIYDLKPSWWKISVRICVPRADWSAVAKTETSANPLYVIMEAGGDVVEVTPLPKRPL
jgi:hypothetical protein